MKKIRDAVAKVVGGVSYISMAVCFVMVFVVAIDVILRKVSGQKLSIEGSNEFSSYFLIVVTMLAIPVMQAKKGHVWVSMFVDMFPKAFRSVWLGIVHLIETVVSGALCYAAVSQAVYLFGNGRASDVLNMPWWPFAIVVAVGFLELTVLLLIDTIQFFIDAAHGGESEKPAEEFML